MRPLRGDKSHDFETTGHIIVVLEVGAVKTQRVLVWQYPSGMYVSTESSEMKSATFGDNSLAGSIIHLGLIHNPQPNYHIVISQPINNNRRL